MHNYGNIFCCKDCCINYYFICSCNYLDTIINSFPIQLKWIYNHNKTADPKVDICLLTFNEYNRQAIYKTIKKFIRRDFDGDWNFMRKFDWRTYHGKAEIYNTQQMFVYTVLNEALEDKDDKQAVYNIITGVE